MAENNQNVNPQNTSQKGNPQMTGFEHILSNFLSRDWIGIIVLILSFTILILLVVLGFKIISNSAYDNEKKFSDVKELLGLLLPVIGTWVGTILVYYFSKENFKAATENVNRLVGKVKSTEEKFQEINVSEVMLKPEDFSLKLFDDEAALMNCNIEELLIFMTDSNAERLPILQKNTLQFIFLIYRSTIERFKLGYESGTINLNQLKSPKKPFRDLTMQDFFKSDYDLAKVLNEVKDKQRFLTINASLAEASKMMDAFWQDVFITETGNKDGKVLGWVTNNLIVKKAELFKKAS